MERETIRGCHLVWDETPPGSSGKAHDEVRGAEYLTNGYVTNVRCYQLLLREKSASFDANCIRKCQTPKLPEVQVNSLQSASSSVSLRSPGDVTAVRGGGANRANHDHCNVKLSSL